MTHTHKLGITIDWDYFVEYNNDWDINTNETLMHLVKLWKHRKHLISEIQNSGEEKTFWTWLHHLSIKDICATVSDSHACIIDDVPIWNDCDTLLLFDQHHDCWETHDNNRDRRRRIINITCDTWGRAWLEENSGRRLVWVYPDHLDFCAVDDMAGLQHQIRMIPREEFNIEEYAGHNACVKGIHICRSGCWCPPWLDEAFVAFIKQSALQIKVVQEGAWDPMKLRRNY